MCEGEGQQGYIAQFSNVSHVNLVKGGDGNIDIFGLAEPLCCPYSYRRHFLLYLLLAEVREDRGVEDKEETLLSVRAAERTGLGVAGLGAAGLALSVLGASVLGASVLGGAVD